MKIGQKEKVSILRNAGHLDEFLSKLRCAQANKLIPSSSRKGRILDVGCGTYPLFLLNTQFADKSGIDQVVTDSSHVSWQEDGIQFSHYDLEHDDRMPFDDEFFDIVTMLAVFEHIEPEILVCQLKEIRRMLKPDGLFIMTTPAGWTDGILTAMAALHLVSSVEFEEHKDAYTPKKISALYQKAGFQKEKMDIGYFELFMNIWVTTGK